MPDCLYCGNYFAPGEGSDDDQFCSESCQDEQNAATERTEREINPPRKK